MALIGSWDGYVRAIDQTATMDDGYPINSEVIIGPVLTATMDELLIKDLVAIIGAASDPVNFAIYTGSTAEEALASEPVFQGVWTAGRNPATFIRRAAHALYLKLSSSSAWTMENIRVRVAGQGKVRARSKF